MRTILKEEMFRALKGRKMKLALGIGMLISFWHIWYCVMPLPNIIDMAIEYKHSMYCPPSVFVGWIGNSNFTTQAFVYYILLPLIATLPFGTSYLDDEESGYIIQMSTKEIRRKYLVSKYIVTFISGGIAVVVPLFINLFITAMFLPTFIPHVSQGFSIGVPSLWSETFYIYPFVYIYGYLIIDFVFSGLIATIALAVSKNIKSKVSVLIIPFLIYFCSHIVLTNWGAWEYNPFYFLQPGNGTNNIFIVLSEMIIIGVVTAYVFIFKEF